eukprot:CAMPEP_0176205184 /NCGR_PEP_ID=MMETSP0121_2-20121125/11466_1 /TAXON_ID=160619 /ORGANISM="Kryptoperidinium foliaceum, Strain CCMP 1326" /LENGTH=324 /DNA_ID=CAMNT_0017544115 /DNA_START=155 /DNA_END=1127 /DNA_ORIENTATION=+
MRVGCRMVLKATTRVTAFAAPAPLTWGKSAQAELALQRPLYNARAWATVAASGELGAPKVRHQRGETASITDTEDAEATEATYKLLSTERPLAQGMPREAGTNQKRELARAHNVKKGAGQPHRESDAALPEKNPALGRRIVFRKRDAHREAQNRHASVEALRLLRVRQAADYVRRAVARAQQHASARLAHFREGSADLLPTEGRDEVLQTKDVVDATICAEEPVPEALVDLKCAWHRPAGGRIDEGHGDALERSLEEIRRHGPQRGMAEALARRRFDLVVRSSGACQERLHESRARGASVLSTITEDPGASEDLLRLGGIVGAT